MSDLVIPRGRLAVDTSVATATDFFATALPASRACVMRISICVETATRIDARIFDGAGTAAQQLNGGGNLDAEALRVFYVPLRPGDTLNLRHSDAGAVVVRYCLVDECQGPVPAPDPVSNEVTIAVGPGGLGKAEDAAHATGDVGVEMLAVRRDTAASSTATDGDYGTLNHDSTGHLWTRIGVEVVPGTAAASLGKAEDAVAGSGDTGVMALAVRADAAAATGANGDYVPLLTDASGRLHIAPAPANDGVDIGNVDVTSILPGTAAANLAKAEDAVAGSGDVGVMALAVRADAAAATGANGDYVPLLTDASGRLHIAPAPANSGVDIGDVDVTSIVPGTGATSLGKAEDAVAGDGDVGVMVLSVRRDAAATSAGASGDYATINTDATGNAWVRIGPELPAGTQNIGDVDAVSVIPGTGATNLGKAIDAVAGATDTGVAPLAIRDDALSALTPAEGDYVPLRVDGRGAQWTADEGVGATGDAAATAGSTGSLSAKLRLITSQLDAIQTSVQLLDNAVAGNAFRIGGYTAHIARDVAIQSAAYLADDAYGAAFVFSNAVRSAGLGCVIKSIQFTDENDVKPELHLFLLDRVIVSGPADNASMSAGGAASWGATERDVVQGPFSITTSDWENIDGNTAVARIDLAHAMKAPNAARDYGARLKTGSAVAAAASTRNVRVTLEVLQD